jgi:hypothetical protein
MDIHSTQGVPANICVVECNIVTVWLVIQLKVRAPAEIPNWEYETKLTKYEIARRPNKLTRRSLGI